MQPRPSREQITVRRAWRNNPSKLSHGFDACKTLLQVLSSFSTTAWPNSSQLALFIVGCPDAALRRLPKANVRLTDGKLHNQTQGIGNEARMTNDKWLVHSWEWRKSSSQCSQHFIGWAALIRTFANPKTNKQSSCSSPTPYLCSKVQPLMYAHKIIHAICKV